MIDGQINRGIESDHQLVEGHRRAKQRIDGGTMNKFLPAISMLLLTAPSYAVPVDCSKLRWLGTDFTTDRALKGKVFPSENVTGSERSSTDFTSDPSIRGKRCSYARGLSYSVDGKGNLSVHTEIDCGVNNHLFYEDMTICRMRADLSCSPDGNYAHRYEVRADGLVRDSSVVPWNECTMQNIIQKIDQIRKTVAQAVRTEIPLR
jgi:hypothetical protein